MIKKLFSSQLRINMASGVVVTVINAVANAVNPYGDGKATGRILTACERFLNGHRKGT